MKIPFCSVLLTAFVLFVAGCGGGSGSSNAGSEVVSPPPLTTENSFLQITPAIIELTAYEGINLNVDFVIKASKPIDYYSTRFKISDTNGIIDTSRGWGAFPVNNSEFRGYASVSNKLGAGVYSTQLKVQLCEGESDICTKPVSGYASFIAVNVVVKPLPKLTNLTELTAAPQVGAWTGSGGNARHTNYVPITLDPAKFSQRWSYKTLLPQKVAYIGDSVNQDGRVFIPARFVGGSAGVIAIDEASGMQLWQVTLPRGCLSPLALANGKVFVISEPDCGGVRPSDVGTINAYDQKTGTLLYQNAEFSFPYGTPPLAVGDDLYVGVGKTGTSEISIARIDTRNGETLWQTPTGGGSEPLSADAQYIYGSNFPRLNIMRLTDGGSVSNELLPVTCSGLRAPMLGPQGQLFVTCASYTVGGGPFNPGGRYEQFAFDSTSNMKIWSATAGNDTTPQALAGTTLYRLFGGALEARNANDGSLRWTTPANGGGSLLVTDNLAFISTGTATVAIDLASRQLVWSFPYVGSMSISSKGVLYIRGAYMREETNNYDSPLPDLIAINLK